MEEYAEAMRGRYGGSSRSEKGRLLDEFTEVTGYHRKSAIRVLGGKSRRAGEKTRLGRPRSYDAELVVALHRVWAVAGRICGKRLAPFMGELVGRLQAWEELQVTPADRRPVGPSHSQSSHPGDEWGELPPQAEQASRHHALSRRFP